MKKTDEKQNPLHREYGLMSNIRWTLSAMRRHSNGLLALIPIGIVCAPLMNYLWTFISKFVIDMITGEAGWQALLWIMGIFTVIQLVSTMLNTYYNSETGWRFIDTRFKLIGEKNRKVMTIDFEHLENPDVMDCYQKASNACNGNGEGIEGMMRQLVNFFMTLAVTAVGLCILGAFNPWIILALAAISAVSCFVGNRFNKISKEKIWDPLAPWWRKDNYMRWQITDFTPAKDIRLFGLRDWLVGKYRDLKKARLEAQKKNAVLWFWVSIFSYVMVALSHCVIYGWLIWSVAYDGLSIGNFSLYLASAATLFQYINALFNGIVELMNLSRQVDDFRSFMDFDGGDSDNSGKPVPEAEKYEFEFRNVSFKYPKSENYALKNLSLRLNAGERLAVVGLNGAGKSTVMGMLSRLIARDSGLVDFEGTEITRWKSRELSKRLAILTQANNVQMKLTVRELVAFGRFPYSGGRLTQEDNEIIDRAIAYMELGDFEEQFIDELSGGQRQRAYIAMVIAQDTEYILLDEPTNNLDIYHATNLMRIVRRLCDELGKTVILVLHEINYAAFYSDYICAFVDGKIAKFGTVQEVITKENLSDIYKVDFEIMQIEGKPLSIYY